MLDKGFYAFAKALFEAIFARLSLRSTASDGSANRPLLDRAGKRISDWMRSVKDGIRSRGQSDENGTK